MAIVHSPVSADCPGAWPKHQRAGPDSGAVWPRAAGWGPPLRTLNFILRRWLARRRRGRRFAEALGGLNRPVRRLLHCSKQGTALMAPAIPHFWSGIRGGHYGSVESIGAWDHNGVARRDAVDCGEGRSREAQCGFLLPNIPGVIKGWVGSGGWRRWGLVVSWRS